APAESSFDATGAITDLACTDGPNHAHCVWAEALSAFAGASSTCTITDVFFGGPTPTLANQIPWSTPCAAVRNASGPDMADSMIVVWSTTARTVEAHYAVSTGDKMGTVSDSGVAPKVKFDGTRFWISYIDGNNELRLSSFDLNGTIVPYSLAGWTPLGLEAFELVHRDLTTAVVLLAAGELDILSICH